MKIAFLLKTNGAKRPPVNHIKGNYQAREIPATHSGFFKRWLASYI